MQHLQSKTVVGFTLLLGCVMALALLGRLTPEAVEAIKWLGASFMLVRTTANATENLSKKQ